MRLPLEVMRRRRAVMSRDSEINTVRDLIETSSLNLVAFCAHSISKIATHALQLEKAVNRGSPFIPLSDGFQSLKRTLRR